MIVDPLLMISLPSFLTALRVFILNESPGFAFLRSSADVFAAAMLVPESRLSVRDLFACACALALVVAPAVAPDDCLLFCVARLQVPDNKMTSKVLLSSFMFSPFNGY